MLIPPPVKIPTPYGGRLEWKLPGGNKLIAHLKDKAKIRHRKRWSQVLLTNDRIRDFCQTREPGTFDKRGSQVLLTNEGIRDF